MQINKFSDFSLRVLIHLAAESEKTLTTREIAERQNISFNHLAKVSRWLVAEGYATATRGRGGGIMLAQPADTILIGSVLRKSEAGSALVECLAPDGQCIFSSACGLLPMLTGAQEAFFLHLDQFTLQDVIDRHGTIRTLAASFTDETKKTAI